jgi:hypothetical protein
VSTKNRPPDFKRDPRAERRLLWVVIAVVLVVSSWLAMAVYFMGRS